MPRVPVLVIGTTIKFGVGHKFGTGLKFGQPQQVPVKKRWIRR